MDPRWNDLDDVRNGLSSEEVNIRIAVFGKNLIDIEEKSTGYILLDEVRYGSPVFIDVTKFIVDIASILCLSVRKLGIVGPGRLSLLCSMYLPDLWYEHTCGID